MRMRACNASRFSGVRYSFNLLFWLNWSRSQLLTNSEAVLPNSSFPKAGKTLECTKSANCPALVISDMRLPPTASVACSAKECTIRAHWGDLRNAAKSSSSSSSGNAEWPSLRLPTSSAAGCRANGRCIRARRLSPTQRFRLSRNCGFSSCSLMVLGDSNCSDTMRPMVRARSERLRGMMPGVRGIWTPRIRLGFSGRNSILMAIRLVT